MKLSQSNELLKHQIYNLEKQLFSKLNSASNGQKSENSHKLESIIEELQEDKKLNNTYIKSLENSSERLSAGLVNFIENSDKRSSNKVKSFFNSAFYAHEHKIPRKSAYIHFLLIGKKAGYNFTPYFDQEYTKKSLYVNNLSAHTYFEKVRFFYIQPNEFFDPWWYLNKYSDVKDSGIDPLLHYMNFGWLESRNPSEKFNSSAYLEFHDDVKQAGIEPLAHYLTMGSKENRQIFSL